MKESNTHLYVVSWIGITWMTATLVQSVVWLYLGVPLVTVTPVVGWNCFFGFMVFALSHWLEGPIRRRNPQREESHSPK